MKKTIVIDDGKEIEKAKEIAKKLAKELKKPETKEAPKRR